MLMETAQSSNIAERPRARLSDFRSWAHKQRWFMLFVVVPVLLSAIYYGFFASDVYVSEARFVIKSPNQKRSQSSTLANLIQTTGLSAGQEQTNEILDYVRSRSALKDLSKRIDVRQIYMAEQADWFSRYPLPLRENTFENLYRYYGRMVDARLDHETSVAVLKVKAFTPQDAQAIGAGLLDLSETLVNHLNDRAQDKQIVEASKRVSQAEQRVQSARIAMRQYRNAESVLDPGKQASGVLEVSTGLTVERAAAQAQLQAMLAAAPRNPAIPALRSRLAAIDTQIASQSGRATGTAGGLANKMTQYETLLAEQEFATQMLTAANSSVEQARAEAQQQQFYLERVVEPNTPDMALLPNRLTQVLTVLGVCLCLYLVGWMLVVGILEHRPDD